jgi:hypothetical protein
VGESKRTGDVGCQRGWLTGGLSRRPDELAVCLTGVGRGEFTKSRNDDW